MDEISKNISSEFNRMCVILNDLLAFYFRHQGGGVLFEPRQILLSLNCGLKAYKLFHNRTLSL